MDFDFLYNDSLFQIHCHNSGGWVKTVIDGREYCVDCCVISRNCYSFIIGGVSYLIHCVQDSDQLLVRVNDEMFCLQTKHQNDQDTLDLCDSDSAQFKLHVKAPMPGQVLQVNVSEGDVVKEGQCLAIVEAMKMETELCAMVTSSVKKIITAPGQQVHAGELLIELEEI